MNEKLAFKIFHGINLHFTVESYSMLKYGTNTKVAQIKFDKLSQDQKYRFKWLSIKYPNTQDMVYAMIGCQFDNVNVAYDPKEAIVNSYYTFRTRRDTIEHVLKKEILKDEVTGFLPIDKLILKHMIGEFSPEYILLKTYNSDDLTDLYDNKNFSWAKPKILKLLKYKSFFNAVKYNQLIETNV